MQLTYNGATLTVVITDTVTNATATQTYTVNIPAIVGGETAYVGFTGGSGGGASSPGDTELELFESYTADTAVPPTCQFLHRIRNVAGSP